MDVEAALLLDGELDAFDEAWDNYVLAGFRMAHIIQDRLDPAEPTTLQRLAAVLLEMLEGSGLPRRGADERTIKEAIEALSAEVRAVREREPGPSPAFRSGCWVVFENAPNGTKLLRGVFTSPGRAQKGLEYFTGLYLRASGHECPARLYEVAPTPVDEPFL